MISWLVLVHILSAMVWIGGGVVLMVIGIRVRSDPDANAFAQFARLLPYVGLRVLMPAVLLVLITGIWMVLTSAAWKISQLWVLLALGLFAVAFLIGAIYLSRIGLQLARMAGGTGTTTAQAASVLDRWLVGYAAVLVVLLVAVWDMVFKPGL
jgi:uncharacterized membrane protein